MKHLMPLALAVQAAFFASIQAAATAIPSGFAMPAGTVDTSKPGFLARPYQTTSTPAGNLAWTEDQLAGLHGANTADLTGADANGYFNVATVVNWNITQGATVDTFAPADLFPGITDPAAVNFSEEVLTYIQFPTAGTYTLGVNSDDGFSVAAANLNPKDRFTAITVGQFNSTRGAGDTTFDVSVSQAGIYPFRLVYWQVGGGASLSWFSVVTNADTTVTSVLINDLSTPGALAAYSKATIGPPYIASLAHNPTGFTLTIKDDVSALAAASLHLKLNGADIAVATSKAGPVTTVSYTSPALVPAGVNNTLDISFNDDATPPHAESTSLSYVEPSYSAMPADAALTATDVDTTQSGFLYRLSQIDSAAFGVLGANVAHAEAQLAGLLINPGTGNPYPSIALSGTQPDGSFTLSGVINFSVGGADLGSFPSDTAFPGLPADAGDNMAGEIITYLDLKAGFYSFGVNCADGFRVTASSNPYDALGTTLGIYDFRSIPKETQFGVAVQNAGIYPIRLVFFRQGAMADNGGGNAELEFYTVNKDGSKVLVNDPVNPTAVKAYWKRKAAFAPFVKYAGPTSFVSPFTGPDVGFPGVNVVLSDGSASTIDPATASLSIDGSTVAATKTSLNGLTTLAFTPTGLQLPRSVHGGKVSFGLTGGSQVLLTKNWSFNLLRNYVLPAPLFFEDFESTPTSQDLGTAPAVPDGWVAENHTGVQDDTLDPTDLNSDFYLGWVVVDKSFNIGKDTGVSAFTPQVLNGVTFAEDTNPLLVNHYMRAESDSRQNGPPGQIQYVTTKSYDLTGKTGIVVAFDSAYEKNQDDIVGLEVSTDGGTTYGPVFYFLQDGTDSQGVPDIIRDGLGNIDVATTLNTSYSDVARYTDSNNVLVGGTFGFFLKAPITPALAPYIEARVNDDGTESKRVELYRVAQADNKSNVKFRFIQAGTSSWYWAIDNWGIYSVPSVVGPTVPGPLSVALQAGKVVVSWPGTGTLQSASTVVGANWQDVQNAASPFSVTPSGTDTQFYRLRQ